MIVTTKSGSKYIFTTKEEQTYIMLGMNEGLVTSIKNLEIGSQLEVEYEKLDMYTCKPSGDRSYLRTSEIVRIEQ